MDRRSFLHRTAAPLATTRPLASPPLRRTLATGLEPYAGPWGDAQIRHLLRRTTFGARQADVVALRQLTPAAAIDRLLAVSNDVPPPPLNGYNDANFTDPHGIKTGETWINAAYDANVNGRRVASLKAWWTGLMLSQELNLREKMTLFWHNHLPVASLSVGDARLLYRNNALLRQYALGNFRQLMRLTLTDPAMLRYLNGNANTRQAPDENLARELQELFTLGKGPASQYTEADVKAVARVLTGWQIDAVAITSVFSPNRHDPTDKQFSAFYNNAVIKGRPGADGVKELDDLLDMVFAQPEVAKFICRKLYRWFVYSEITQTEEDNLITPLAKLFRDNQYEIKSVVETLLRSAHFFDEENVGAMIKNPVDLCVGVCRQFDIAFPPASNVNAQYAMWNYLRSQAASQQFDVYEVPNVAGWAAYYQVPGYYQTWINSDTLPKRVRLADVLISPQGYRSNGAALVVDPMKLVTQFSKPEDPNVLIQDAVNYLFPLDIGAPQKAFLKNILLSGQTDDYYWTGAWAEYVAAPTNATKRTIVLSRLQSMFKYLLDVSEHQLS